MAEHEKRPGMEEQIRSLPDQLRWAGSLRTSPIGTQSEIVVVGMGGSGITGDYLSVLAAPHGTRVHVHKGYAPVPLWAVRQRPTVLAVSYSGDTEETLDFVLEAHESGLQVATISSGGRLGEMSMSHGWPRIEVPGGLQPRAALGYLVGAAIAIAEAAHAIDDQRLAIVEAADLAETALEPGSRQWEQASHIAAALAGRIPVIYGGGTLTGVVAQRWKTQINENAKRPAWSSVLPEVDHNEIVGWESMSEMSRDHFGIVALTDPSDHDRIVPRLAHTRDLTEDAVPWLGMVESSGTSLLARLISLTVVGDLVSWMLATESGVDPLPVATIEELKKLLSEDDNEL